MYRPKEIDNLDTAFKLLIPIYKDYNGVRTKVYPDKPYSDAPQFFGNFKSHGGTETEINGVYAILDTAQIVTWYRTDIKSDCRIMRLPDLAVFKIINEPENVDNRGQFLIFKVERIKGEV